MTLTPAQVAAFQKTVWQHFSAHRRDMPWRQDTRPYYVLVSELMLQQTQVSRVVPKFEVFIRAFPTIEVLAAAPLADVLTQWVGLGYNRRARFLHQIAQKVVAAFEGELPADARELEILPGIGPNTAGAILAYAFNQPVVFIETNVRSVYFHHFFEDEAGISDAEIRSLVQQTLDTQCPREWYWALMDYGTFLKASVGNNIARSRHYKKQSKFEGSLRQLRGKVVRQLTDGKQSIVALEEGVNDPRLPAVLASLENDGLLQQNGNFVYLTGHLELP